MVEILESRYVELERMAQMSEDPPAPHGLSKTMRVERGLAPATGFERTDPTHGPVENSDFLTSIASARQEAQTMFELSQDLGVSLSLSETLSVLSMRLRRMIPYDSIAVFVNRNGWLLPELVSGENFRMLSSLKIKVGEGLCGWVAANCKPIVNGNPQVEPGYVVDPGKHATLQSALVVPLEGLDSVVGVLAMYHANRDAFTPDHLRILLAVASKVALSVENALKYQQAESSATTDYLTGLPNARSLFVHLAQEVARCRRMKTSLAVLVCDIDGFKQINDSFGHLEGDKLLREFTARLKDVCRGYDYVARMGGDEFVITAPGLTAEAAKEKADRLNQAAIESGPPCVRKGCDHAERGHGFLSGRRVRCGTTAGRSGPPDVLHEADSITRPPSRASRTQKLAEPRRNRRPPPCCGEKLRGMLSPSLPQFCWEDCCRRRWCGLRPGLTPMRQNWIPI